MNQSLSPLLKFILPFLIGFALLRGCFGLATFPNPDEAYYWLWGQQLDFSYYDHPPLLAWIQGLIASFLGTSNFTLRFPNFISNAIFFYTYYQLCCYLYGKEKSDYFWLMLLLILASPLYFMFIALAWPDHLLITCVLVGCHLLIRFLDHYAVDGKGKSWQLYGAAVAMGLAGLCKYNALFVVLGMAATIAGDPRWRPLLRDRRLYFASAIGLAILLPILIWNIGNDFQSFHYYMSRSVDGSNRGLPANFSLKWNDLLVFSLVSIFTLSPFNVWAIVQAISHPPNQLKPDSAYRPLALWIFAISTLTLIAIGLVSTALYYWNITAYLLLFPLLPPLFLHPSPFSPAKSKIQNPKSKIFLPDLPETLLPPSPTPLSPPPFHQPLFVASQLYGLLFATLLVVHYSIFPLSALVSLEGDPDSRMLFGWKEVATVVQTQAKDLGDHPFFVTTDYRSASALAYQLKTMGYKILQNNQTQNEKPPEVFAISDRVDQFDFWYDSKRLQGRHAVILSDDWHPVQPKLLSQFVCLSEPTIVPVIRFGILIKNYYVQRGYVRVESPENSDRLPTKGSAQK
jgi:hypothetical protein